MALVAILFIVAVAAPTALGADPDKDAKMAGVNKVVSMLEDLQKQVLAEGTEEAKTYDKFACFCKDNIKDKQDGISSGKDQKTKTSTSITDGSTLRDKLDGEIKELVDKIDEAEKAMAKAKKEHEKAVEEYVINSSDLQNALKGLDGAIKVMKANKGKTPSLLQLPEAVTETLREAALMADTLGLTSGVAAKAELAVLMQKASTPGSLVAAKSSVKKIEPYKFHADGIIGTLEKLQSDFKKEKDSVDSTEKKRVDAHKKFMQTKKDFVKDKSAALDGKKEKKAKTVSQLATDSKDFSGISAQLLDDMEYLKELAQICSNKAKTWDQRSKVRRDELTAITSAITIVKGTVSEKTSKGTVRLIQQRFSARQAALTVRDEDAMEAVEADVENVEDSKKPMTFLQRQASPHFGFDSFGIAARAVQKEYDADTGVRTAPAQIHDASSPAGSDSRAMSADNGRQAVMVLLRTQGAALHSSMLTGLAAQIASDSFAKIKKLIQELIERMLQESANEASQKGWCDKAIGDAEQKRGYTVEKVENLNNAMAKFEARRDTLTEELKVLDKEMKELKKAQKDADEERTKEKGENKETVKEAKAGLEAVQEAIKILDRFYKTAAKEKVSLAQGPKDDMPDAGFDSGEAYTGAQGAAGGVIGMLEVIESDFVRTVKETEKAEAQAEDDHLQFTTETQSSLAEKKMATDEKTSDLDETKKSLDEATDDLKSKTDSLVNTLKELLELQPTCVDTGMSYKERVAAREAEVEALKKALCIFTGYEKYGAKGAGAEC